MNKENKTANKADHKKAYAVLFALGAVFFLIYAIFGGAFSQGEINKTFFVLCDASFIPAMLYIVTGLVIVIANDGFFDAFTYASRKFSYLINKDYEDKLKKDEPFHEYKKNRHRANVPAKPVLLTGFCFLVLSSLCLLAFYKL
ncbi:MAG: DUF3899 domain-containing protein [Eubacteriaceae bacterium]|nr:DUF3899 domain-containing protein [Eubacteriaceae bacterium]